MGPPRLVFLRLFYQCGHKEYGPVKEEQEKQIFNYAPYYMKSRCQIKNLTVKRFMMLISNYIIADRKEIDKQNLNGYTISDEGKIR